MVTVPSEASTRYEVAVLDLDVVEPDPRNVRQGRIDPADVETLRLALRTALARGEEFDSAISVYPIGSRRFRIKHGHRRYEAARLEGVERLHFHVVSVPSERERILDQLDIRIPALARPIRQMSGGQRQAVAIARAIYWNAQLMIMDEPTAALGVPEQRKVLALVRTLRERGVGVIIISHNLQDVLDVADRVVVMRRGRAVGERQVADTNTSDLLGLMIGAERFEAA